MGYSIDRWVSLGKYALFILVLFIGICFLSSKLSNYYSEELKRKEKLDSIRENMSNKREVNFLHKNVA
jgi:hypothetical protein